MRFGRSSDAWRFRAGDSAGNLPVTEIDCAVWALTVRPGGNFADFSPSAHSERSAKTYAGPPYCHTSVCSPVV